MTKKSKEHLDYTLATLAIERLAPSNEALRLCAQVSEGTTDADTAVVTLLRQHRQTNIFPEGGISP